MSKISVCILTKNDADTVTGAVESVRWADEIVVVDNASSDRTVEVARALGVRVVQISTPSFGEMRRSAAEACSNEWVFSLDADERCTPALREEIKALLAAEPAHDAFQVPRRNYMMGRWIKGSGWYPNYRGLQLFRKDRLRYLPDIVHEGYELTGDRGVGKLQNDVWHFSYQNLEELVHKMNVFSSLGAQRMASQRVSMGSALGHAVWAFLKHYIFKAGFRDGWAGFVIALGNFEGTFYRYAKAHESMKGWDVPANQPVSREPP
jgi:glycosyltransferase involved in cell wall biosynthesis